MRKTTAGWFCRPCILGCAARRERPAQLAATCHNTGSFESWLQQFKKDALRPGISPKGDRRGLTGARSSIRTIIRRDHGQAVFNQTFLQFSDRIAAPISPQNGEKKMHEHAAIFREIEKKYGVPAPVLTAFWGLESDYGGDFGNFKILTRARDPRLRLPPADFFRPQLFDALRLIEKGDQRAKR